MHTSVTKVTFFSITSYSSVSSFKESRPAFYFCTIFIIVRDIRTSGIKPTMVCMPARSAIRKMKVLYLPPDGHAALA